MSRAETLRTILRFEAYWGSPLGGSWSDHGPGREMSSNPTRVLDTINDVAEVAPEDFEPGLAEVLGETAVTPTFEEEN